MTFLLYDRLYFSANDVILSTLSHSEGCGKVILYNKQYSTIFTIEISTINRKKQHNGDLTLGFPNKYWVFWGNPSRMEYLKLSDDKMRHNEFCSKKILHQKRPTNQT